MTWPGSLTTLPNLSKMIAIGNAHLASCPRSPGLPFFSYLSSSHSFQTIRVALKQASNALLLRANGLISCLLASSPPPGWLPDTLLSQFEDEIRRVSASKPLWESTLKRMSSDVLLMLPLTPHLFLRLGNDHSVPHSEVASA
jgi:hypothetical protein